MRALDVGTGDHIPAKSTRRGRLRQRPRSGNRNLKENRYVSAGIKRISQNIHHRDDICNSGGRRWQSGHQRRFGEHQRPGEYELRSVGFADHRHAHCALGPVHAHASGYQPGHFRVWRDPVRLQQGARPDLEEPDHRHEPVQRGGDIPQDQKARRVRLRWRWCFGHRSGLLGLGRKSLGRARLADARRQDARPCPPVLRHHQ